MPFPTIIQNALDQYSNTNTGTKHPLVSQLKNLLPHDQDKVYIVLKCAIKNEPTKDDPAHSVFVAIMQTMGEDWKHFASVIRFLQAVKLFTPENLVAVKACPNLLHLIQALNALQDVHLFARKYINAIIRHKNLPSILTALNLLKNASFPKEKYFDAIAAHENPRNFVLALYVLHDAQLLTEKYIGAIVAHQNPLLLARALQALKTRHFLTEEYFEIVAKHPNPQGIADCLYFLKTAKLFTKKNQRKVIEHPYPNDLALAFSLLANANLLKQENIDVLVNHLSPAGVADSLCSLAAANLLNPKNRRAVKKHPDSFGLAIALSTLLKDKLLTQENFDALLLHPNPLEVAEAFVLAANADCLTNHFRNKLKVHRHPKEVATAIFALKTAGCLTPENEDKIIQLNDTSTAQVYDFATALKFLAKAKLLTQNNFNVVMTHPNIKDLSIAIRVLVASHIPLTQSIFNKIAAHPYSTILTQLFLTLGERALLTTARVSQIIAHPHPKNLLWIIEPLFKNYFLTPKILNHLLVQQNLHAMPSEYVVTPQIAAGVFTCDNIEALFESNYSWLMTTAAKPLWKELNKHQSDYPEKAMFKVAYQLMTVIHKEVMKHLSQLASPKKIEKLASFLALIDRLKTAGISEVLENIRDKIADRMCRSFEKIPRTSLLNAIDSCQYLIFSDFSNFHRQIQVSEACRAYNRQMLYSGRFFSSFEQAATPNESPRTFSDSMPTPRLI